MEIKFWYILSAGVIALDLILKIVMEGVNITVIQGVLSFVSVHNYGASFGVMDGARWFFIVLAIVFVIGMILFDFLYKKDFRANGWYRVGFALILGGIIGNLIDRIAFGYVRDFISLDFINFPVFNIADMALTFGCICLVVFIIFFAFRNDKEQEKTVTFTQEKTNVNKENLNDTMLEGEQNSTIKLESNTSENNANSTDKATILNDENKDKATENNKTENVDKNTN